MDLYIFYKFITAICFFYVFIYRGNYKPIHFINRPNYAKLSSMALYIYIFCAVMYAYITILFHYEYIKTNRNFNHYHY